MIILALLCLSRASADYLPIQVFKRRKEEMCEIRALLCEFTKIAEDSKFIEEVNVTLL